MTLTLLPLVQQLSAFNTLKLICLLTELDTKENISPFAYKVYGPTTYKAFGAGEILIQAMQFNDKGGN